MSSKPKKAIETRGRPKKADHQNPEGNYYEMFPVHAETIYQLTLMYVLEVFHSVKEEKRIGHSCAGFTIYEKSYPEYSFNSYQKDLKDLGAEKILDHNQLAIFSKRLIGIGPTCVFKQIIMILKSFLNYQKKYLAQNALTRLRYDLICQREKKINQMYPYLRFKAEKLEETKEIAKSQTIYSNVKKLWPIFAWILTYSMFSCFMKTTSNKYLRALSTDAPQSMQSIIGHPNLEQVILLVTPDFNKKLQKLRIKGSRMITNETNDQNISLQNERFVCELKKQQSDEDMSENLQSEFQQKQFHQSQKEKIQPKQQIKIQVVRSSAKKNQNQRPKSSFHLYNQIKNNQLTEAQKLILANEQQCFQNSSLKPQDLEQYGRNPRKKVKMSQNFQQFSSKGTEKSKLNQIKAFISNNEEQLCEQQSQEN